MISVLISIKPKWCELIASGQKTIEVRKTKPKIDVPFKCYIYCTKQFYRQGDGYFQGKHCGKVIGEFVCDFVDEYKYDYCPHPEIGMDYNCGDDWWEISDEDLKNACLTETEFRAYAFPNEVMYGWHMSDLVIYEQPKELSEFYRHDTTYDNSFGWAFEGRAKKTPITRPPQSWCYVEKGGDE